MQRFTISLDDAVAQWARMWAARHDSSVSRLVGELLAERMRQEEGIEEHLLDLPWCNLLPASVDHVPLAPGHEEESVLIDIAQVAIVDPVLALWEQARQGVKWATSFEALDRAALCHLESDTAEFSAAVVEAVTDETDRTRVRANLT